MVRLAGQSAEVVVAPRLVLPEPPAEAGAVVEVVVDCVADPVEPPTGGLGTVVIVEREWVKAKEVTRMIAVTPRGTSSDNPNDHQ
jgi:hypothetical protein